MIDLTSFLTVSKQTAKQLTDLVGIIERNITSYDRIKARFRRKRIVERLERILALLSRWHRSNNMTLWRLASMTTEHEPPDAQIDVAEDIGWDPNRFAPEIEDFLQALLETKDLIDQFEADIVSVDYKLYEELQDAVDGRINIVRLLVKAGRKEISTEHLRLMYSSYTELVASVREVKDRLQSATRTARVGKSVAAQSEAVKPKKRAVSKPVKRSLSSAPRSRRLPSPK